MAKVSGAELLVRCLQQHGVQFMFGIVGTPVTSIAEAAAPSYGGESASTPGFGAPTGSVRRAASPNVRLRARPS